MLLMTDLGSYMSFKPDGRWKEHKSLFMKKKISSMCRGGIAKKTWVITCKHDKGVVCKFDVQYISVPVWSTIH